MKFGNPKKEPIYPDQVDYKKFGEYLGINCLPEQLKDYLKEIIVSPWPIKKPVICEINIEDNDIIHFYFIEWMHKLGQEPYYLKHNRYISKEDLLDAINDLIEEKIIINTEEELTEKERLQKQKKDNKLLLSNYPMLQKVYLNTAHALQHRQLTESQLKENTINVHHIKPKCQNGKDNDKNLVTVTWDEHVLLHAMLFLIYPTNKKLYYAFMKMKYGKDENDIITTQGLQNNKQLPKQWAKLEIYNALQENKLTVTESEKNKILKSIANNWDIP